MAAEAALAAEAVLAAEVVLAAEAVLAAEVVLAAETVLAAVAVALAAVNSEPVVSDQMGAAAMAFKLQNVEKMIFNANRKCHMHV